MPIKQSFDLSWIGLALIALLFGCAIAASPALAAILIGLLILAIVAGFAFGQRNFGEVPAWQQRLLIKLLLLITVFWPSYISIHYGSLPGLDARRFLWLGISSFLIYSVVGRKQIRSNILLFIRGNKAIAIICIVILGLRALSAIRSPYLGSALAQLVWETLSYVGPLVCGAIICESGEAKVTLSKVICIAALICGAVAVSEEVFRRNILVDFLIRFSNDSGVIAEMTLSRFRDGRLRAEGPFEHPLLLAEFGSIALAYSASILLWKNRIPKVYGVIGVVGALLCVTLSFSRSALICSIAGALWIAIQRGLTVGAIDKSFSNRTKLWFGVLIMFSVLSIGIVASRNLITGSSGAESQSSAARGLMLQRGVRALKGSPLIGYGMETAGELAAVRGRGNILTLDNYILSVAIESGLLYAIALSILLLWASMRAGLASLSNPVESAFFAGTSAAIGAMYIFRSVLAVNNNLPILFMLVGFALGARKSNATS